MNYEHVNYSSRSQNYSEKRNDIQSKQIQVSEQPSYFDDKMSRKDQEHFVDFKSATMNRFFPLMKNLQLNCVEPFTRGGISSVLQDLDSYQC
jgi:hypothetical protein